MFTVRGASESHKQTHLLHTFPCIGAHAQILKPTLALSLLFPHKHTFLGGWGGGGGGGGRGGGRGWGGGGGAWGGGLASLEAVQRKMLLVICNNT